MKFSWLEWIPFQPWRVAAIVEAADEVPDKLPLRCAVLVGTPEHPKWIAFDCPCKRNHRIMVSLDSHQKPHWTLKNAQRLTLTPSVDAWLGRERCHYFVRDGKIIWTPDR